MMTRCKHWLTQRFLPAYLRDGLMEENARLTVQVAQQQREMERLEAYLSGMERALRLGRKITIQNEVREHECAVGPDGQQ